MARREMSHRIYIGEVPQTGNRCIDRCDGHAAIVYPIATPAASPRSVIGGDSWLRSPGVTPSSFDQLKKD
jgi:hypothetical protein